MTNLNNNVKKAMGKVRGFKENKGLKIPIKESVKEFIERVALENPDEMGGFFISKGVYKFYMGSYGGGVYQAGEQYYDRYKNALMDRGWISTNGLTIDYYIELPNFEIEKQQCKFSYKNTYNTRAMNIIDKLNSLKVGESCYYMGGITLKCVEDNSDCTCCHFRDKACFPEINCAAVDRKDGKNVVFAAVLDDMEKESEILYVDGILRYKGKQYQLVNGGECYKCDFQRTNEPCSGRMKCTKDSHFKEIINHE